MAKVSQVWLLSDQGMGMQRVFVKVKGQRERSWYGDLQGRPRERQLCGGHGRSSFCNRLNYYKEPSLVPRSLWISFISLRSICMRRFAVRINCAIVNNWSCLVRGSWCCSSRSPLSAAIRLLCGWVQWCTYTTASLARPLWYIYIVAFSCLCQVMWLRVVTASWSSSRPGILLFKVSEFRCTSIKYLERLYESLIV